MDFDPFWLFLFIFFVVAPLIERVLKGGSRGQPPRRPQQRPPRQHRPPQQRYPAEQRRERPPRPTSREESREESRAAEMIPPELWEILTGGRPLPRRTEPQPAEPPRAPEPIATRREEPRTERWYEPEEASLEATVAQDERVPDGARAYLDLKRRRQAELDRRRAARTPPSAVVSLETEPLPDSQRHEAFHRTLGALPPPAARVRATPPLRFDWLHDPAQLRRAVLFHEILGRPKALDLD